MIRDDGLTGISFENYYGQDKAYEALEFEPKFCRHDGVDARESDATLKLLASSCDDYWYPCSCSLETIDCVAKLNVGGQPNKVGLIQITQLIKQKTNRKRLTSIWCSSQTAADALRWCQTMRDVIHFDSIQRALVPRCRCMLRTSQPGA
ncbi:hypothetical protein PHMEG_00027952 [Phytophthora megakarya]|uniref:Uncharacterized protein n=1 Tax=Phytophthora megakarya TaxID=4795 RepID=A0A225V616_9STRA|nr:hypothetical protein PHMEG_00027952 [Phytophthora megakarya]